MKTPLKEIYCCGCDEKVQARLTDGKEIYPHRGDLVELPFWKCDACGNYVGCHHKTNNPNRPLGNIPTPELRKVRREIHRILDRLWKSGDYKRKTIYAKISEAVGWPYHTSKIRNIDEARRVYKVIREITE